MDTWSPFLAALFSLIVFQLLDQDHTVPRWHEPAALAIGLVLAFSVTRLIRLVRPGRRKGLYPERP